MSGTSFVIVRWLFRNCETYPDQVSEQQDADDGVEDDPQDTKRRSPWQAGERVLRERGWSLGGVVDLFQENATADLLERS